MYDIIIVGGGPAGSTLARLIGKKYKVLLLEKRNFKEKNGRIKRSPAMYNKFLRKLVMKTGLLSIEPEIIDKIPGKS